MIAKTELTDNQMNEVYNVACELLTEADETFLNPENEETKGNILSELVTDYVFENDYSNEEEIELCNQVGI